MPRKSAANFVAEFNGLGSSAGGAKKRRGRAGRRRRAASRSYSRSYSRSRSSSSFDLNEILSGRKSSGLTRGVSSNAVLGDLLSKMSLMPSLSKGLLNINPISALSAPLAVPSKTNLTSAYSTLFSRGVPVAPGAFAIPAPPASFDSAQEYGSSTANAIDGNIYDAARTAATYGEQRPATATDTTEQARADAAIAAFGGSYF